MTTRREFLEHVVAGSAALGLSELAFLDRLPAVRAAESSDVRKVVACAPDLEPLIRLIEESPRNELLERVAARIRAGTSYAEVLGALLLAAVRNVQPWPSVGFKFHAVLVVNSAHLASLAARDGDRWLPLFWALDYFKNAQADERRRSGWRMPPVDTEKLPPARQARQRLVEALDAWDAQAVDPAVAAFVRTAGANEVFELFCRYGARDFRSIGHKAIFVANAWRTLETIGWRHAEPVLRSLAQAMTNHGSDPNPAQADLEADRPWRLNLERIQRIPDGWLAGRPREEATRTMLEVLREGTADDACEKAVSLLIDGVAPQSIWDAVLVGAGELLMRQPGIVPLHAVTTSNALRYAFEVSGNDQTRRMLLLQNCAFLPMFREAARRRGALRDLTVETLADARPSQRSPQETVAKIFDDIGRDTLSAAREVRAYAAQGNDPQAFIATARRLIFLKGRDAHDYKFSSAVLEDFYHVSPSWRDLYLATSVFNLRGAGERDNRLVERTRRAFES